MAQHTATTGEQDRTAEDLVDLLTNAGPDGTGQLMTEGQAEALVHRVILDRSRAEAAEAIGVSKSAVDNRLTGARRRALAAADLVRLVHQLGGYDGGMSGRYLQDLREEIEVEDELDEDDPDQEDEHNADTAVLLSRLDAISEDVSQLRAQQERQQTATETPPEDEADTPDETADRSARLWGDLMAHPQVHNVSRPDGAVTVTLDNPTEELIEETKETLGSLDYAIWSVEDGGADLVKVRGRGGPSTPDPEPRALDEDLVSVVEHKPHVCQDCGRGFATGAGLGGHRRYCPLRRARMDAE